MKKTIIIYPICKKEIVKTATVAGATERTAVMKAMTMITLQATVM